MDWFEKSLKAKRCRNNGATFEGQLEDQAEQQGILATQMPLGCERRGRILVQVKTKFDWILTHNGINVMIDCKSQESGKSFPYSHITEHQLEALLEQMKFGNLAGYLVNFRELQAVVFFDAQQLASVQPGDSIHAEQGTYIGSELSMCLGNLFV